MSPLSRLAIGAHIYIRNGLTEHCRAPGDVEHVVGGGEGGRDPAEDVGQAGEHQQPQRSKLLLQEPADNADEGREDVVQTD